MAIYAAAACLVLLACAHSVLGERFLLVPLFRRGRLPRIFGDESFAKGTLRFAWHVTSLCGLGGAFLLCRIAGHEVGRLGADILYCCALVSLLSAFLAFGFTRGRHLSWLVFLLVGFLAWWVATR